jgi:tRNA threonylcarbamoyl adenosine modification protein YeaZ
MQLVVESATAACSVALIAGGQLIDERHEVVGRGHAERLVPLIRDLLGDRRPASILVGCGPGSFTGLRVGLAAAHGLAIGWRVPLAGFSSLALIVAGAPGDGDEYAVALHGGHGQLFVQTYGRNPLDHRDSLRSLYPGDAAAEIGARVVLGSGAEALVTARGYGAAIDALPRAADARLLPESLRALAPRPIYGRAPDAKPMA